MASGERRNCVQVCRNNQVGRSPEILESLRKAGWAVDVEDCLDQCTRCDFHAMALVRGRFLIRDTAEELEQALQEMRLRAQKRTRSGKEGRTC